jgi:hypothetical protein
MEWVTSFFSKFLPSTLKILPFLIRRKEERALMRAEINQKHKEAIRKILRYSPEEFMQHCQESLQLLSEGSDLAEGFDSKIYADVKDSSKKISQLRQFSQFVTNRRLHQKDQDKFSHDIAELTQALQNKLDRLG